jgi:phosphopantothenoylcysteine synthetase/decarboxylase
MTVFVVGTPASSDWVDVSRVERLLGQPPRFEFRTPQQAKAGDDPDLVAIVPATFNSLNKLAYGIADNYAVALASSALGSNVPMLVAPMINNKLWGHPALQDTLHRLERSGVHFLNLADGSDSPAAVRSGTGDEVVAAFDPTWVLRALKSLL